MYLDNSRSKISTVALVVVLLGVSLMITYLLANAGTFIAPTVLIIIFGVTAVASVISDYRIGFFMLYIMGGVMSYISRLVEINFPMGTVYDGLAALTFIALFINGKHYKDWTGFKNPITITFTIIVVYQLMQVANPYAVSRVAWLVAMRGNTSFLMYIVCFQMFYSLKYLKRFTWLWLGIALVAALYGMYQEYVGLPDFEMNWVRAVPERYNLYFIWGRMRKFSILSDPSAYGLFMALGGLAGLVLAMGPFKTGFKIFAGISGVIMLIAMTYSGTRTAIAMAAVGIVFYIVVTLRNRKTIIFMIASAFIGAALIFGPFYGGTANRIRSTFNPSEDASMSVRDAKRIRLQNYIQSHPIGGGLFTTGQNGVKYSKGHELAQGWDTDSGYLLIGLELGWIGLLLFQTLFFLVMLKGINNYFSIDDPFLKTMTLTYLVPFFALSVAHFTQDALFTKPMGLVVIATYAIMVRMPSYEKKLYSVDLV
ncbi:O-antigen ligase family protein [Chryseosolibacter indicus]|uniref:O-antigen ligase family protein n=1 Tax=Chryseosolibacter indicus TaxID=2782351 RepID=A0ABS5VP65_9BACT|nr:O-antigen ligase family protein [Chryseosolibacter indicus]MBT1702592.1 O-antigen ligase family protein [Chryseosolibacter indicus]